MLTLHLYKPDSKKYDITNLISSVTWSGDINTLPRQAEVSLNVTGEISSKPAITIAVGDMIIILKGNKELIRGYVFKTSTDDKGFQTLTIYDQLIYAAKNTDSLLVKNKTASDIIISTLKKFGLKAGNIEPTGYKIKKLVLDNKALSDIFDEVLQETKTFTKTSYNIYSDKGAVNMVSRKKSSKATIIIDDIITGSREVSIEEMKTQVLITKGQLDPPTPKPTKSGNTAKTKGDTVLFTTELVKNNNLIAKYGIMQHVESVDDKTTASEMKKKASALLEQLGRTEETISMEFIGHVDCITGNIVEIKNETAKIMGRYYITSDSHSFSNGVHRMTLQLSNRLE